MITANCIPTAHGLYIRFTIPDSQKGVSFEYATAENLPAAKRKMYFRLRKYIYERLSAWLRQRQYAIAPYSQTEDYSEKMATAHELLLQLERLQSASHFQLCAMVARKHHGFEFLAPSEHSRHYNHYQRDIVPVLEHCIEMTSN